MHKKQAKVAINFAKQFSLKSSYKMLKILMFKRKKLKNLKRKKKILMMKENP